MNKRGAKKRGTKKLYNPNVTSQLFDFESENNSDEDENSSPVVVRALHVPQVAGNRSSPRLSAKKTIIPDVAAHTSTSSTEPIQKDKNTLASTRSAHADALDSAIDHSSSAENRTPIRRSKSPSNKSPSATKKKSADHEYIQCSSKRKFDEFAAGSSGTVLQADNRDVDFDANISIDDNVNVEINAEPDNEPFVEGGEEFAESATDDSILEEANLPLRK